MRYFAYGSNMDPDQMAERCPGSAPIGAAVLRDYRLVFVWDSPRWLGGVGHVEPAPGDDVWGVLWELSDDHVRALDGYEQVHKGIYARDTVAVVADGETTEALIYLATDRGYRKPSRRYMGALIRGAQAFALPSGYVERLERVETAIL